MSESKKAHYRCLGCGLEYWGKPGPQKDCVMCSSVYFKWLNYERDFAKGE